VEKSVFTNDYQYYESGIDKHIELDFNKEKEYNENVVEKSNKTYTSVSEKRKNQWFRLMLMILCFEITYGRYLNDISKIFMEADEKHEVTIPGQLILIPIIEIEDETGETSLEKKGKINIVDVHYKLR
jgi:hypothetical protein